MALIDFNLETRIREIVLELAQPSIEKYLQFIIVFKINSISHNGEII